MPREEVLDLCYAAHTMPAVRQAMEAHSRYLAEHPYDEALLDMGAMLARYAEALDSPEVEGPQPAPLPVTADREATVIV